MPATAISSALKNKQKEGKLSIAKLAKAIGVNVQSVTAVLKGKSSPNKTTAPKYAKFLGLSAEKFAALVKPAGKVTASGKAKKKTRTVTRSVKSPKTKAVTLAEAADLAADTLAVATYRASSEQRKYIAAVLGA